MNERYKREIAILINNTLTLAMFVILAIVFNYWWLSLISPFFFVYLEKE